MEGRDQGSRCPLAFEGDRQIRLFRGDVTDYEAFRRKELGTAADQPHRIRYKRLAAA
jgi:energy-dependent translational throttle protein EttA